MSYFRVISQYYSNDILYKKVEPKCIDHSKPIRHIEVWSQKFNSEETDFKPVSCKLIVFYNKEEQITDYVSIKYKVTNSLFDYIIQYAENMNAIVAEVRKDISKLARTIIASEANRTRRLILDDLPTKIGISLLKNRTPLTVLIIDLESNRVIDIVRLKTLTSNLSSFTDWFEKNCGFNCGNDRYHWFVDDDAIINVLNDCGVYRDRIHNLCESSNQGNSDEEVTIQLQMQKMKSKIVREYASSRIESLRHYIVLKQF